MTEQEYNKASAPLNTGEAGKMAATMRTKGMSTAKILIALFELDNTLSNAEQRIRTTNDALNVALKIDINVAKSLDILQGPIQEKLDQLSKFANMTADLVSKLTSLKTTTEIGKNLGFQSSANDKKIRRINNRTKKPSACNYPLH